MLLNADDDDNDDDYENVIYLQKLNNHICYQKVTCEKQQ